MFRLINDDISLYNVHHSRCLTILKPTPGQTTQTNLFSKPLHHCLNNTIYFLEFFWQQRSGQKWADVYLINDDIDPHNICHCLWITIPLPCQMYLFWEPLQHWLSNTIYFLRQIKKRSTIEWSVTKKRIRLFKDYFTGCKCVQKTTKSTVSNKPLENPSNTFFSVSTMFLPLNRYKHS